MNIINGGSNIENLKELLRALTYAEMQYVAGRVFYLANSLDEREIADALNVFAKEPNSD